MISDVERYPSAPCDSSIAMSKNSEAAASRIYLLAFSPTAGEWSLFRVKNDVGVFAQCSDVEAGTLNSDRVRIIDNTRFSDGTPERRVSSNARLDGHATATAHMTHTLPRAGVDATSRAVRRRSPTATWRCKAQLQELAPSG